MIGEASVSAAAIFDEAVTVDVAEIVHPIESRLNRGPDPFGKCHVIGALQIGPSENDKKWRSVYAAVVAAERHFAKCRHFALPQLMHNFAWL